MVKNRIVPIDFSLTEEQFDNILIIEWLRTEKNIDVTIMPSGYNSTYFFEIRKNKTELITVSEEYETYDESIINALEYIENELL